MLPELDVTDLPPDAVEVGRVGEAWGIKGWFKVLAHSSAPEAIFSSKRWYLAPAERGTRGFEGHRLLRLVEVKEHAGGIVAQAQAIQDRTAAEKLRGARVFIARGSFPSTGPDEHYWVDLIGLQVIGAADPVHSASGAAWLAQQLGSRLVCIEGCGHYPMYETPDDLDRALSEFLDQN